MASDRTLEDLDLTKDEVKRLGEALKDEKFRKMLVEYAEEISNPENKRKAEEEIQIMENERGMSVQFIHPEPGYVLKTTVDGTMKAFINICQNDKIEKPKANKQTRPDGKRGIMWHIPHSFAPPRDDYDKTQQQCKVFDVVFHPDTFRMAMSNDRFKKLVEDTALDGIEIQFGLTLDKKNIRRPKLKFKGTPQATVIRERLSQRDDTETQHTPDPEDFINKMPYPYENKTSAEKSNENQLKNAKTRTNMSSDEKRKLNESKFTVPKYSVTHVSEVDISEYRNAPDARTSTCPKTLVIRIELPLLNSAAQASLDIFEKKLILESVSPAAYKLDLSLPYRVSEDEGSAKFDKSKRTLIVTLPVLQPKKPELPFSDGYSRQGDETNSNGSSSPLMKDLSMNTTIDNTVVRNTNFECSAQANLERIAANENVEEKSEDCNDVKTIKCLTFPQNMKWVLPNHQFSQDNETVSFVINVKNIEENTVEMLFPQNCAAVIQFMSIGAGCFPVYYRLYVQFPSEYSISSEHCSIDVSNNNLVFIILKDKNCRGLWDSFSIGVDDTHLEEKQFLTESNLQKELSDLDKEALEEANMPGQVEMTPELSVVEMSEKRLTIDIKPPKGKKWKLPNKSEDEDEEDYNPPSSAEIEVVHKHPLPDLHSILKQRTASESSEDISNVDPDSPRSEGEELSSSFNKKRSVSFSNHVDHASFKSSASVSSMTPALKSKRRRQRKREEKRNGRVRCNSEGGTTSSSEECLHSVSDSYSQSEEEGDSVKKRSKGGSNSVLQRAISDPGPDTGGLSTVIGKENGSGVLGKEANKTKKNFDCQPFVSNDVLDVRNKTLETCELVNVSGSEVENELLIKDACIDLEIQVDVSEEGDGVKQIRESRKKIGNEGMSSLDKNKIIISEIKDKLAEGNDAGKKNGQKEDSDDDDFEDAVSSLIEVFKTKVGCNESINGTGDMEEESFSKPHREGKSSLIEEIEPVSANEPVIGVEFNSHSGRSKNDASDSGCNENEKTDVETMLSWEEGEVSSEHVTVCALQFSNSLMYDLDIE